MKKSLLALALAVPLVASAQNLLTNGSFETVGLAGWTLAGGGVSPTIDIAYGTTTNTFGEAIIADNASSLSPDAAGARAAYFVDDIVTQTLTQTFSAAAGTYAVGFSYYFPKNGLGNPGNSTFTAAIDAQPNLLSVSAAPPSQVWNTVSGTVSFATPGSHTFKFTFTPNGNLQSEDVVIDRVYVTAVPEPETFALMAAGLAGIGFMARRRRG